MLAEQTAPGRLRVVEPHTTHSQLLYAFPTTVLDSFDQFSGFDLFKYFPLNCRFSGYDSVPLLSLKGVLSPKPLQPCM